MYIKMGHRTVTLRGDPGLRRTGVSLKAMFKTLKKGCSGVLVEFQATTMEDLREAGDETVPLEVQQILEKHERVFETPSGLPPQRATDHAIVLIERTSPSNVRLYRYPHIQ